MDHTSGAYRSTSSFHASWSPSPTRATRAMTDGSSRMACPLPGRPAQPGRAVHAVFLTSSCTASGQAPAQVAATYKGGASHRRPDTHGAKNFLHPARLPRSAAAHDEHRGIDPG